MAYPNLASDNEPGAAFTVELTEKNQPMDQGPQVGFEGLDDKDPNAQRTSEQRQLLTSDSDLARRPRLDTAQRVSCMYM